MVLFIFVTLTAAGWINFFVFRRASLALQVLEFVLLPVSLLSLHTKKQIQVVDWEFVVLRILPISFLTISTVMKAYFVHFLHQKQQFNQFIRANSYHQIFKIVRLVSLTILAYFLQKQVIMYFLIICQIISTSYQYFFVLYRYAQSEWCSMVSQLWGWISLVKYILYAHGYSNQIINLFVVVLAYAYFYPSTEMVVILQKKINRILRGYKKKLSYQYNILLFTYYVNTFGNSRNGFMARVWSNRFRLQIKIKMGEYQYKINELYLHTQSLKMKQQNHCQVFQRPRINQKKQRQNDEQILSDISELATQNAVSEQKQVERIIVQFLNKNELTDLSPHYQLDSIYFVCNLLCETSQKLSMKVYQMYYELLNLTQQRRTVFREIGMQVLFNVINNRIKMNENTGDHIQQIQKYNQLHNTLQTYKQNQHRLIGLVTQSAISISKYRQYLDDRISLKRRIAKLMKVLEFISPCNQGLIMKYYIIDRFINNNDIASQRELMNRIKRYDAKKTKMINFLHNTKGDNREIFLCELMNNKSSIVHSNRNFQDAVEIKKNNINGLKLKNILPAYWKDVHEQKMTQLRDFQNNYQHDAKKNYYITTLVSQKILQVRELKVVPYFQLNSNVFFFVQMDVLKSRNVSIQPIENFIHQSLVRSKRLKSRVAFSREIYEDQNLNAIDQTQKTVQIFNKMYVVCTRTNCFDLVTKNLLEFQQQQLNEDIEAIIKFGKSKNDQKTKSFENAKKKVHLFQEMKNGLIFWVVLLAFLFAGGDVGIADSFRIYNYMISRAVLLELRFRETFMGTVTFESILLKLGKNSQIDKTGELSSFIESSSSKHYLSYYQYVNSLILQPQYRDIIFQQYQSIDFDENTNTHTIANHMAKFSVFMNSAADKINNGNQKHWVLEDYQKIIRKLMAIYDDQNYLENKVIYATKMMLLSKVSSSKIVFWFCELATILSPLFGLFVFIRAKIRIQRTLCKPLQMSQRQLYIIKVNTKLLSRYLSKQIISQSQKPQSLLNIQQTLNTESFINSNKETQYNIHKQQKAIKKKTGTFSNHYFFIAIVFGFYLLGLLMCSLRLYYSKSSHAHNIDGQLSSFQIFSNLNNQLFILYEDIVEIFLNDQNLVKVPEAAERIQNIYKIDVSTTIQDMLLDPEQVPTILSSNPCSWTTICGNSSVKINPYPVEVNRFLSNANIILSLIRNKFTLNDERVAQLTKQTFASCRYIYEMSHEIFNINYESIAQAYIDQFQWIGLSYVGVAGFMSMMIIQTIRMLQKGKVYGQQILSLFPSTQADSFSVFSFQVNSIMHRTNFARKLDHS